MSELSFYAFTAPLGGGKNFSNQYEVLSQINDIVPTLDEKVNVDNLNNPDVCICYTNKKGVVEFRNVMNNTFIKVLQLQTPININGGMREYKLSLIVDYLSLSKDDLMSLARDVHKYYDLENCRLCVPDTCYDTVLSDCGVDFVEFKPNVECSITIEIEGRDGGENEQVDAY